MVVLITNRLSPDVELVLPGGIPSSIHLPAKIDPAINHLPRREKAKWKAKEHIQHAAERDQEDTPDEGSEADGDVGGALHANDFGIGPGLVNLHLVTSEWLAEHPLWPPGEGTGIFEGMEPPSNAAELGGLMCELLGYLYRTSTNRKEHNDTFASRISDILLHAVHSEDGASFALLLDDVLHKRIGAYLLLLSLLLDQVLPDNANNGRKFTQTKSFWAYRLMGPLAAAWKDWRKLPDFRMKWRAKTNTARRTDDKQYSSDDDDGESEGEPDEFVEGTNY